LCALGNFCHRPWSRLPKGTKRRGFANSGGQRRRQSLVIRVGRSLRRRKNGRKQHRGLPTAIIIERLDASLITGVGTPSAYGPHSEGTTMRGGDIHVMLTNHHHIRHHHRAIRVDWISQPLSIFAAATASIAKSALAVARNLQNA